MAQHPIGLKLVILAGPDEGKEVALGAACEIGTDPDCDFPLTDSSVSRRHARLSIVGDDILVRDLESKNGTFIGETRVRKASAKLGTVLRFGRTRAAIQPRWHLREISPSTAVCFGELYGESLAMREIFSVLERVADGDVPVLVEGEGGTGKGLVARSLHAASRRAKSPFVVLDCSAVRAELVETELFGRSSAGTGSETATGTGSGTGSRAGAFQRAHGGTLLVDELGELPLDVQPKLLRALESREVRPVGSDAVCPVDVRFVATTNRDLRAEVQRGRFRADLFYHLDVVRMRIPPLRARPEDIPGLVARLLFGKLRAGDQPGGENMEKLLGHPWPGNVAELKSVVLAAITQAKGKPAVFEKLAFDLGRASSAPATIAPELPGVSQAVPYEAARAELLARFDKAYFVALLRRFPNDLPRAAVSCGLGSKEFHDALQRTGLAAGSPFDISDDTVVKG